MAMPEHSINATPKSNPTPSKTPSENTPNPNLITLLHTHLMLKPSSSSLSIPSFFGQYSSTHHSLPSAW